MPRIDQPESPLVPLLQGVHLFHFEGAPCAQRVRFALAEKGIERGREAPWASRAPDTLVGKPGTWVSRHVSLIKKDHMTAEYAEIQPHMVVPALVHDGRLYIESMDIVKYIDETWPDPPLVPTTANAAALAWSLVETAKRRHVSVRYVSFRWGLGRLAKLSQTEEARLRSLERAGSPEQLASFYGRYDKGEIEEDTYRSQLEALEAEFAALEGSLRGDGRPFLTGDAFSVADIIWSLAVLRLDECGYPFRRNFPRLCAWYGRIKERRGFQEGVMARHRTLSGAFKVKAAVENFLGVGLRGVSRTPGAEPA
jgi:glutathione S-transferase